MLFFVFTLLHWIAWNKHCNYSLMNQLRHIFTDLHAILLALAIRLHLCEPHRHYRQVVASRLIVDAGTIYRTWAKPDWVKHEVLRLKALMPHTGCRKIADCFNRRFAEARQITVGKTYVSNTIRQHYYEIQVLRKQIKNTKPKSVPKNLVWALDLTGKTTLDGQTRMILGIIEHASRAAVNA